MSSEVERRLDTDGEVQGRQCEEDERGEKSGEEDSLVPLLVDDLSKRRGKRDIIRQQGERKVVTGERRRAIPLLRKRSSLSSASLWNASKQKSSHKLTAWKM